MVPAPTIEKSDLRNRNSNLLCRAIIPIPGIYAAGNCTTVPHKQIVVTMGEGAKAGLGAFDFLIRNEPVEEVAQAA